MASAKTWAREWRVLLEWVSGFTATIFFHQPAIWLLHIAGVTPRTPYNMTPVPPFGIPSVISLAFWGGVWAIVMIPLIARIKGEGAYWISAALFGALAPTLVAFFVISPLKGQPIPSGVNPYAIAFTINAMWGLGTAILFRFLARTR